MHLIVRMYAMLMLCCFSAPPVVMANCSMHENASSCCRMMQKSPSHNQKPCCKQKELPSKADSSKKGCDNANCNVLPGVSLTTVTSKMYSTQLPKPNEFLLAQSKTFRNDSRTLTRAFAVVGQPPNR